MIKYLSALAIVVVLSGCSSGSSDDPPSGTANNGTANDATNGTANGATNGTTNDATNGTTNGEEPVVILPVPDAPDVPPSNGIVGAWYGANSFGDGVMIIDADGIISAFADSGSGQYQTVFGPYSGNLLSFTHRNSDNPAFDEITLVGDAATEAITYNLTASNDGQQINNSSGVGNFSMAAATETDLLPISVADIAGDWTVTTSYCPVDCDLKLELTFDNGSVSGFTQVNQDPVLTLAGTVSVAEGATQFLNIQFIWAEKRRSGVLYFDRRDTTKLFINTFGPGDEGEPPQSLTASMIRL